jgi:hypothetical protein
MDIKVIVTVPVPEGATYYGGDLLDNPIWYKCMQVGVSGDHWFYWDYDEWKFFGHRKPYNAEEIKEEVAVDI